LKEEIDAENLKLKEQAKMQENAIQALTRELTVLKEEGVRN